MASASDLLAETEAAISACLKSQAYTSRGLAQQRASLASLQAFRRELVAEIKEGSGNSGSMASVGQIDRVS